MPFEYVTRVVWAWLDANARRAATACLDAHRATVPSEPLAVVMRALDRTGDVDTLDSSMRKVPV